MRLRDHLEGQPRTDGKEGQEADVPNESEWPERSRTKRCMLAECWAGGSAGGAGRGR